MALLVYVHDIVLAGNDPHACSAFKSYLHTCFSIKDLGPLKYFLGIKVARGPKGLFLSRRKYAFEIVDESGFLGSKPSDFLMEVNHKLALATRAPLDDVGRNPRLVGCLIYLTITRPDLCYAVHILSQFMQAPREKHMHAAYRILHCINGTPDCGLLLKAEAALQLVSFCDSDWDACPLTRRPLTGYLVTLGGSPVSWRTKKQTTVSRSSAEAEYRAMAATVSELVWLKSLLASLGGVPYKSYAFILRQSSRDPYRQ